MKMSPYSPTRLLRPVAWLAVVLLSGIPGIQAAEDGWIPLFDGKTLDGWTVKIQGQKAGEDAKHIFRVVDGTILATYEAYQKFNNEFGHLFHDIPWSRYKIRMEYKFNGDQLEGGPGWGFLNSGVMIHGQSAASMGIDQSFPDSVEVQFLGSDGKTRRPTGNICTPATVVDINGKTLDSHCVDSASPPMPADEWTEVEVHVDGSKELVVLVEGVEVIRVTNLRMDDGTPLDHGTISIQAESHDCAYRNIEIQPLD